MLRSGGWESRACRSWGAARPGGKVPAAHSPSSWVNLVTFGSELLQSLSVLTCGAWGPVSEGFSETGLGKE